MDTRAFRLSRVPVARKSTWVGVAVGLRLLGGINLGGVFVEISTWVGFSEKFSCVNQPGWGFRSVGFSWFSCGLGGVFESTWVGFSCYGTNVTARCTHEAPPRSSLARIQTVTSGPVSGILLGAV